MYISVLTSDLNSNPWFAVQWSNNLQSLLNNDRYDAGVNREFHRSAGDDFVQEKSIREISTPGSWVTAHVYQLVTTHSLVEVVSLTTPVKKKKKAAAPKKKAAKKKAKKVAPAKKKAVKKKAKKIAPAKKKAAKKTAKKSNKKPGNKKNK